MQHVTESAFFKLLSVMSFESTNTTLAGWDEYFTAKNGGIYMYVRSVFNKIAYIICENHTFEEIAVLVNKANITLENQSLAPNYHDRNAFLNDRDDDYAQAFIDHTDTLISVYTKATQATLVNEWLWRGTDDTLTRPMTLIFTIMRQDKLITVTMSVRPACRFEITDFVETVINL